MQTNKETFVAIPRELDVELRRTLEVMVKEIDALKKRVEELEQKQG